MKIGACTVGGFFVFGSCYADIKFRCCGSFRRPSCTGKFAPKLLYMRGPAGAKNFENEKGRKQNEIHPKGGGSKYERFLTSLRRFCILRHRLM